MNLNSQPAPPAEAMTLDRLATGVAAVVTAVDAADEDLTRLQTMGICTGQPIHTLRTGSRMIVCAAGTRIGLARPLAAAVTVRVLDDPPVA